MALRIPATDLTLARKQAENKGLPYQTYITSLLYETLAEQEKRKEGSTPGGSNDGERQNQ